MRGRLVGGLGIAALVLTHGALAQQPAAPTEAAATASSSRVADVTLRAVKDRRVRLSLDGGKEATGKLLAFEGDTITLAFDDGSVVTVARAQVAGLKVDEPVAPPVAPVKLTSPVEERAGETQEAAPPPRPRYFGAHLGMAPGVAFDLDYSYFHAFTSFAWLFPLVSSGQLVAFTVGLGASFPFSDHWRFDIFAHVAPLFWRGYNSSGLVSGYDPFVGVGGGIGLHYTAPNGFSIGVKLPVIGAAAGNYGGSTGVGQSAGFYYLASAMSLPVFSVGYRF